MWMFAYSVCSMSKVPLEGEPLGLLLLAHDFMYSMLKIFLIFQRLQEQDCVKMVTSTKGSGKHLV